MEQPTLDVRPLTFAELKTMALQYIDSPEIKQLVDEAMTRRLTDVGKRQKT